VLARNARVEKDSDFLRSFSEISPTPCESAEMGARPRPKL
jgi:hypothetical protein